ncbi:MAG TPA: stalk domain-containing protein [Candidatus Acidoferrum sp.]|nr:stalk domain-containing protein [Candidatus Acidoferrum sp.]
MKTKIVAFLALILIFALSMGTWATQGAKSAELWYKDIKITLNGTEIIPKDANGNIVEPFIIDGTTYLPVKAIATAMGLDVVWDGATNTVALTSNKVLVAPFTLSAGQYVVGEDIAPGKYDCTAVAGYGNFQGEVESLGIMGLNVILSTDENDYYSKTYDNLRLIAGDTITINSGLKVEFIAE